MPTKGEYLMKARVVGRVRDDMGKPKGTYNPNPMIDTREYEVMFDDGTIKEYSAIKDTYLLLSFIYFKQYIVPGTS